MTDIPTIARDSALHCEAKKHAYRQTQDGVVVSFVLHPQEVPEGLAIASLGTRYMLAMVEINDDETPKEVMPPVAKRQPTTETPPRPAQSSGGAHDRRPFTSLPLPQQAALLCQDPVFRAFLNEEYDYDCGDAETAAEAVREKCQVTSRAQIIPKTFGGTVFTELREQFIAWKLVAA